MAAIREHQEFALHSLNDENKNKTFVFVKLTDSALKSIEDYMKLNSNLRQSIARPTIQFHNDSNQGAITLPLTNQQQASSNKKEIKYSFNLSNVDADGQQGSFEFLRQRKATKYEDECIESLGSMLIKMQIHAQEDIYQKTKVKMANAELDAKRHSTKVIKETGPNVGRKTVKKTIIQNSNTLSGNINQTDNQLNSYSSYKDNLMMKENSNNLDNLNRLEKLDNNPISPKSTTASHLLNNNKINSSNNKLSTTTNGHDLNSINQMTSSNKDSSSNFANNNQNNSNNSNASNNTQSKTVNNELLRKPVRDRLIHLLAIRPFKKPELLARLNRDGLREKDKKGISALLSQISNLKDNAYHLTRGAWHEVQINDWSFYTAEEREIVRKRNPLTNNSLTTTSANSLSSNTSAINSISPLATFDNQQSPSMFSNNSPSNKRTIETTNSSTNNNSNNLEYDYATVNKKQRISHHKANNDLLQQQKKISPPLSSALYNGNRSTLSNSTNKNKLTSNSLQTNIYDDVINTWENKPKTPDEQQQNGLTNGHSNNSHSSPEFNSSSSVNSNNNLVNGKQSSSSKKSGLNSFNRNGANQIDRYHNSNHNISLNHKESNHYHNSNHHQNTQSTNSHFNSFQNHHHYNNNSQQQHNSSLCSTPNSSPDSGTGSNDGSLSTSSSRSSNSVNEHSQQQDYLSKYTEINSMEQLRKYKQDFNCEYEEYKKLHNLIDRNAAKFALLEQELRQAQEGTETWNRIMERILREYDEIKRDNTYLNARNRMQYLHTKLSHIKSLILNFTQQSQYRSSKHNRNSNGSSNCNGSIKYNSSSNSRIRSTPHTTSVPQQSNRSKMITSN